MQWRIGGLASCPQAKPRARTQKAGLAPDSSILEQTARMIQEVKATAYKKQQTLPLGQQGRRQCEQAT